MAGRPRAFPTCRWRAGWALGTVLAARLAAQTEPDPAAAVELAIVAAETSLKKGDLQAAESRYREALFEGFLLTATLERLDGRQPEAREALRAASLFRLESPEALQSLAVAELQVGEAARAVEILTEVVKKAAGDTEALRLLAKALAATGQLEPAMQKLDEATATVSDDPERLFLLATEYLWLKRVDAAARLFAKVVAARPIPESRVLIGRSYRDAGEYERARAELRAALDQDPSVRRAHYYLGMVMMADATTGADRLDKAIGEFREELKLAPEDPLVNDQLGLALLEAGRPEEALPALEAAVRGEPRALYLYHLGRCQLALDRAAEAAASSRRALELGVAGSELEKMHYQLGLALRKLGAAEEAAGHLAEARNLATRKVATPEEASPLSAFPRSQRLELKRRVREAMARAYFNLGVLQTQSPAPPAERFARATAFLERAAEIDPDFPGVQAALGIAYFNARQFDKAGAPLARALAARPEDAGLKRMLALSSLNTEAWEKAAALLDDDPERQTDASLQAAYGLALLRSRRAAEAEKVLAGLLARQGDSADLSVLLGQAYAEQRKYEPAIESLQRALRLDANVAGAHGLLGNILLGRGSAAEAVPHLEAAARLAPGDAAVHDQLGRAYQKLGRTDLAQEQFEVSRRLKAKH